MERKSTSLNVKKLKRNAKVLMQTIICCCLDKKSTAACCCFWVH
uniref:Uncharacterized protein n=1 Tax=Anguilla anguilla TaxID=7936 RepID=A0A0E9VC33_ANGAN